MCFDSNFLTIHLQQCNGADIVRPPLPYAYEALEPNIDTATMRIHFEKHYTGTKKYRDITSFFSDRLRYEMLEPMHPPSI